MGISSIMIIVGSFVAYLGLRDISQARASKRWQSVDGVIVSSDLAVQNDQGSTLYRADIQYTYTLNGRAFTGERVHFGDLSTSDRKPVFDILLKYPKDARVVVFYNPEDPAQTVLEPGFHGANWFLPALGAGFFIFGLIFIFIGLLVNIEPLASSQATA